MCTCAILLRRQMFCEEGEHLAPTVHRLFGPVERPVPIEDTMAGTVIAVELIGLAVLRELGLVQVHLLGTRRAVVVAEDADEGARKILRHVDGRDRCLGIELLLAHHDATAPEIGAGIDVLFLAGIEESVPAARAGAEEADLAVVVGLCAHPSHRGLGIADHLAVGNTALGAHLRGYVVGVALARTLIEVGADREIAVMREPPRRLNVEFAPPREMVDQHHARKSAWTGRLGNIGSYRRPLVAADGHVLAGHASVERHRCSSTARRLVGRCNRVARAFFDIRTIEVVATQRDVAERSIHRWEDAHKLKDVLLAGRGAATLRGCAPAPGARSGRAGRSAGRRRARLPRASGGRGSRRGGPPQWSTTSGAPSASRGP